jgi:O-antigen/teichoic acid export membrane protein
MFKKALDYLSGLSWFLILAFALMAVSVGYMLFGLLGFAFYWLLLALFMLGASFREPPRVITKTAQGVKVTTKK